MIIESIFVSTRYPKPKSYHFTNVKLDSELQPSVITLKKLVKQSLVKRRKGKAGKKWRKQMRIRRKSIAVVV